MTKRRAAADHPNLRAALPTPPYLDGTQIGRVSALNCGEAWPRLVTALPARKRSRGQHGLDHATAVRALLPVDGFCAGGHAAGEAGDELGVAARAARETELPGF
jgi:hypothetical protein